MAPLQNGVREAATPEELSCTSYSSIFWKVKIEKKKLLNWAKLTLYFKITRKQTL